MKKKSLRRFYPLFFFIAAASVFLFFIFSINNLSSGSASEEKDQLERALTRAAVSCYAMEGAYPPSAEYLIEHYGVQLNEERFVIKYDLFASNLMPDITVLEK
ncbi:MAG: hypothetical protein E7487_03745 [Ruminococcaceae bacterium]|nr:hypothetical protein [Oscillospiraceae bacterium]